MSDRIENLYAAIAARPAGGLVGWRAGEGVCNEAFLARVRAWHELLRGRAGRDFALYLDDSIEFGAALLGAWHAGKTIWLSADTLEATCASLRNSVDGFLGQFPAALQPLSPAAAALQPPSPAAASAACTAPAAAPLAWAAPAAASVACASPSSAAAGSPFTKALVAIGGAAGASIGAAARATAGFAGPLFGDMPALVVFTSGSTGAAQAIPKKLSQLASEVETLDALFGRAAGEAAVLATVSHQHIYGLLFKVLWPLSTGRAIHAMSITFPEELAPAMAAGPCVLIASPAHLKRLPDHLDWSPAARMLRSVFSSGGPLAPETALSVGGLLGEIPVEVYGSSETGGVAWRQRSRCGDDSWLPFPTVEWRLGEDETLEVRSPHLEDDNWLALADRAARSGDKRFLLLGRSDRIVKIEEKRISLSAMEATLLASGLAAEARVILCEPAPGERQRLAAFIVPTAEGRTMLDANGKPALNARLRATLSTTVEAVALPRRWRYLDQMPVNAQGKTTLAALLALLDNDDGAVSHRPRFPQLRELEREPLRVLLEVTAPANLLYFDGHFDVAPILPGVVQVEWAIHYGRQYFGLPTGFKGINALKFQQVIQPGMPVQLELSHDAAKGSLQFRYASEAGQHSSGRIMLGAGDV